MLQELLKAIGFQIQVVQITPGPLHGTLRADRACEGLLLQVTTNQCLCFQGDRDQHWLAIALEQTDNLELHRVRGEALGWCSIQGFNRNLTDSFWQVSPHSHSSILVLPLQRVIDLITLDPSSGLQDVIDSANIMQLAPNHFQALKRFLGSPGTAVDQDQFDGLLLEIFSTSTTHSLYGGAMRNDAALMRDLVAFGCSHSHAPITLADLGKVLLKSTSSINKASRNHFGLTPMQLLKQIRLQQVQHTLLNPSRQALLGTRSIQGIASHYGFMARNHFARDYRLMFDESPSQTLQRQGLCAPHQSCT